MCCTRAAAPAANQRPIPRQPEFSSERPTKQIMREPLHSHRATTIQGLRVGAISNPSSRNPTLNVEWPSTPLPPRSLPHQILKQAQESLAYAGGFVFLVSQKGHPIYTLTNMTKEPCIHLPTTARKALLHMGTLNNEPGTMLWDVPPYTYSP